MKLSLNDTFPIQKEAIHNYLKKNQCPQRIIDDILDEDTSNGTTQEKFEFYQLFEDKNNRVEKKYAALLFFEKNFLSMNEKKDIVREFRAVGLDNEHIFQFIFRHRLSYFYHDYLSKQNHVIAYVNALRNQIEYQSFDIQIDTERINELEEHIKELENEINSN